MKEIIEEILNDAQITCKTELDKFKWEHREVIADLMQKHQYVTLFEIIFKQGFLIGLKSASKNRELIKKSL